MPPQLSEAVCLKVAAELETAEPVTFEVPPFDAFSIVGLLQYAWRNPALDDGQRSMLEQFGRAVQKAVADQCPTAGDLLEDGWNRALDLVPGASA